ncbi:copper amine oxidase N-terminal domain-containing protein, partial [Anaerotignum sp.]
KEDVSDKEDEDTSKDDEQKYIRLTIGQKIVWLFDEYVVNDVAPEIKNDRTMLPIRIIAEALGATVTWNETEQKVTITDDDLVIEIFIGQPFATVNGEPVKLDAPAYIANDRTYLPLRFVAENLGATVVWNDTDNTVTIYK